MKKQGRIGELSGRGCTRLHRIKNGIIKPLTTLARTRAMPLILALSVGFSTLLHVSANATQSNSSAEGNLSLVGNRVATLIDTPDNPARAVALVEAALSDTNINFTATTQAWSGSGLRNGKFHGYIDHYSLDNEKQNYLYSIPYASVPLHIASRNEYALSATRLDKIYRQRLGVENRFANTDQLRGERSVSWARAPDFWNNIQQLAGRRVEYIIADVNMLNEFNKMLLAIDQEPLYISTRPVFMVDLKLGMNRAVANAQQTIDAFNTGIQALKDQGKYDAIYYPAESAESLLDASIYEDILRRW